MGDASSGAPSSQVAPEDRLDSWKEIAAYLRRDVTTVQRWEKREGMPVHRHLHDKLGSVYAFPTELDVWWQERSLSEHTNGGPIELHSALPAAASAPRKSRRGFLWLTAALGAVALAGTLVLLDRADYFWQNPLSNARFAPLTDFEGREHAAAISRDGKFVAFLSDRDGPVDVWVTQVGTG